MLALQGLQYQGCSLLFPIFWYWALVIPVHFWCIQRLQPVDKTLFWPYSTCLSHLVRQKFFFPFLYVKNSFELSLEHLWFRELSHLEQAVFYFAGLSFFTHFMQLILLFEAIFHFSFFVFLYILKRKLTKWQQQRRETKNIFIQKISKKIKAKG